MISLSGSFAQIRNDSIFSENKKILRTKTGEIYGISQTQNVKRTYNAP